MSLLTCVIGREIRTGAASVSLGESKSPYNRSVLKVSEDARLSIEKSFSHMIKSKEQTTDLYFLSNCGFIKID